jgi:hypothetical protein
VAAEDDAAEATEPAGVDRAGAAVAALLDVADELLVVPCAAVVAEVVDAVGKVFSMATPAEAPTAAVPIKTAANLTRLWSRRARSRCSVLGSWGRMVGLPWSVTVC